MSCSFYTVNLEIAQKVVGPAVLLSKTLTDTEWFSAADNPFPLTAFDSNDGSFHAPRGKRRTNGFSSTPRSSIKAI